MSKYRKSAVAGMFYPDSCSEIKHYIDHFNKEMPSLVFVLTRMDKVFKVFPVLEDAVESFGGGKPKLAWK